MQRFLLNKSKKNVSIIDNAGQFEDFSAIREEQYNAERVGVKIKRIFLICFNLDNKSSLDNALK